MPMGEASFGEASFLHLGESQLARLTMIVINEMTPRELTVTLPGNAGISGWSWSTITLLYYPGS
jgi:hypothetical protein